MKGKPAKDYIKKRRERNWRKQRVNRTIKKGFFRAPAAHEEPKPREVR